MKPLPDHSFQMVKTNPDRFQRILLTWIACITIVACGEANSNNLPERPDSAAITEAPTTDSGANSRPGGADAAPPAPADTAKLGGTWFLVPVLPSDTAAGKIPTIKFDEVSHKFSGNTGCNNMQGSFTLTDSTLKIDDRIITTRMACAGYNEDAFLKNLPKVTGFRFENGMLVLLNDKSELSRWTREPVKPAIKTT